MTTTSTKMNKTAARRIACHLIGGVHVVAANPHSRTWGYNCATGARTYTTATCGSYLNAQRRRSEDIAELMNELMDGTAPDWATLDFVW